MATRLVFRLVITAVLFCAVCFCASGNVYAAGTTTAPKIKSSGNDAVKARSTLRDSKTQKKPEKKTGQSSQVRQPDSTSATPAKSSSGTKPPVTQGSQFHRESTQQSSKVRPDGTAANTTNKKKEYQIDARILISGEAARKKGKTGFSQLNSSEKELTAFLGYRDYRLVKKSGDKVKQGKKCIITFDKKKSVTVTPLSESPDRVKLAIEWKIPGEEKQRWKKLLYFKRNHRSLIGGPHIDGGGMYLLSLEIQ